MFSIEKMINKLTTRLIKSKGLNYRYYLLDFTIGFYLCAFTFVFIISLIRVIDLGWQANNFIHGVLLFLMACLYFMRRYTPYITKVTSLIATFYLIGLVADFNLGLSSGNYLYFAISVMLSATFLSIRATLLTLFFIIITQVTFMYLTNLGWVTYQVSPLIHINSFSFWITHLSAFIIIISTPLITLGWLNTLFKISHTKLIKSNDKLTAAKKRLVLQATTDELTSLPNRRALISYSESAFKKFNRDKSSFSVLMIDLDYFKNINDSYGHDAGDKVLVVIARVLIDQIRDYELVARAGGEEFVAILIDIPSHQSRLIAERIREAIKNTDIEHNGITINVTTSIGLSHADETDSSFEEILKRADQAVYKAKDEGRDCVAEIIAKQV